MDQLKKALAWLKLNHFWVLVGIVPVIGLVCWYMSSGALSTEYKANEGTIKGAFNTPTAIMAESFHANQTIIDKQREQVQMRAKTVLELWQQLYDRQRSEVLKWPEKALTQEFRDAVEKLKFGDNIPTAMATVYQNYIRHYFPELPAKIQARIIDGEASRGGGFNRQSAERERGAEADPVEEGYVCEWRDQQEVRAALEFVETPSPLQIWVTQEDLWAYDTVLNVVAATNAAVQADRPDNAAVRTIESLAVGKKAALVPRGERITLLPAVRATAPAVAAATAEGGRGSDEAAGRGDGAPTADQLQVKLLSQRYIDAAGNPIVVTGGLTDFQTPFGLEYKRLPIRLELRMDVKSLSYLIAQCANQPLQIEVREVRINPTDAGGAGGRVVSMDDSQGGSRLGGGTTEVFPSNPNLARVVIQGVIYIFNEPSAALIQAAKGGDSAPAQNNDTL